MLRLLVIYQLVLSLMVGPMLCCCAVARLGHDPSPASRTSASDEKTQRRHCCGGGQKSPDGGRKAPGGDKKPGDPANCPCKDRTAKAITFSEAVSGPSDPLGLFFAGVAQFDRPVTLDGSTLAPRIAAYVDSRSPSCSAADLLFAHHNLRC